MSDETKIIRIVVDSSKAVDGSAAATRALQNLEKQAGSMDSTMARIEKSIVSVGLAAKTYLAEKLVEIGARILEMGKAALESAANLGELAEQMGITTTGLQAMQFAAVQNNLKIEELQTGISKFSQKIGEAAGGSKQMIDALNDIGVKMLDANGKIRPTETLLQEVARAILSIEDPAKRAAASVEFFGKAGTKMLPTLKELADGMELMAAKAAKAGAMISAEAIDKLDKMADAGERNKLVMRALFAENAAGPLTDVLDFLNRKVGNLSALLKSARGDLVALLLIAMNPGLAVGQALQSTPEEKNAALIPKLEGDIAGYQRSLDAGDLGPRGQKTQRDLMAKAQAALGDAKFKQQVFKGQSGFVADTAGDATVHGLPAGGASNPTSKEDASAAESLAERIKKETDSLKAAAAAQDLMTAAARNGDVAFVNQEAHVTALQKAIEIYGGKLDAADPKVQKLTASLEAQIKKAKEGAAAQTFVVGTTELQKQNELLEAQNRLMNEAPEVQAREIALIKSKQEAQKAGNALTAEDVESRRAAIEANERLKTQAEQLKAAQELWTAPLKQALQNIQTAGADAFETMLNTGNFTFQSLGDTFGKIIKRMAAEFLALATIRPVMSIMVQTLSGTGLISGNTASQLGFPSGGGVAGSSGGGSATGGSSGGLGGFSIPSMGGGSMGGGGLGDMFSGISSWMNTPFTGGFAGVTPLPAGAMGPASNTAVGGLSSGGVFGAGGGLSLGGMTPGSAIGGGLSIGMGAMSLANAGGSTAKTIGGVGQMIGGALMMIPTPWTMAAGAIISLASSFLPGLFDDGPKTPPQPALNYSQGAFYGTAAGAYTSGGDSLNGGSSLATQAAGLGTNVLSAFSQAGLKVVQGNLYGGEIAAGTDHTLQDKTWVDRPYTQTALTLPGGGIQRLTYNDASMDPAAASQYLYAQVFKANVLKGGVTGASDSLKTALTTADPRTEQDITDVVGFTKGYDQLGKAANSVKDVIDQLGVTMDAMRVSATKYGLSLEPIAAAQDKATKRTAQDFIDSMLDPLAVQMRALDDERDSALASAQYIRDNIEGVYVDTDKIATYYLNKRAALEDQYYQGAVESLQNLIARLTYGDLANASPDTSLIGTKAAYDSNLASARSGDTSAITNLSGYAEAYANSARSSFASSPEYVAIITQMRQDLAEQVASITGVGAATAGASTVSDAATVAGQNYAQLAGMVSSLLQELQEQRNQNVALNATLQRIAVNM